ncbi:hypothetical protein [Vibrio paracholerae]|uniref:hypothetical protein n=1 Tax=Vibrio paracholerae TaxID=650003 RepID=UPI000DE55B7B|nr:hypothetical protein [Vibrio paracholerae]RBM83955.1 hypothetical protein DLR74_18305 [Vibrio paracholerae]
MGHLLRKISPNKWDLNKNKTRHNFTADSITGCTRTTSNTLSVWQSTTNDFESDEVKSLIVALAISMPQPAKIDVIWLDEAQLTAKGLTVSAISANSVYTSINNLHKDIVDLDHEKLGLVAEHIMEQYQTDANRHFILKAELVQLVIEWMEKEQTFDLQDLNENWAKEVSKKLAIRDKQ